MIEKMIDYQKQIDNAYLTLKSAYDNEQLRPGVKYEVYSAQANDKTYRIANHASIDIDNFKKNVKNVITNFGSDVIQIWIYVGKKKDIITIKITDTYIELVDEKQPVQEKIPEQKNENAFQGLGAIEELRNTINQEKYANELRFLKQDYEFKIERLKDEVNEFRVENLELAEKNEILSETLDEIEADLENSTDEEDDSTEKLKILGMIAGIGKVLGMKNEEIAELSGIITGSNDNSVNAEPQKENTGGLVEDNTDTQENTGELSDTDKMKAGLVKWINALNAEMTQSITWILTEISNDVAKTGNANLINDIMDFIEDHNEENPDNNPPENK